MNFCNYFLRACAPVSVDSLVPVSLCPAVNFSKDNLISGLFLPNLVSDFQNFSYSFFIAEDFINLLFNINLENVSLGVLSAPFQISFRGGFFAGGAGTESLSNLVFFLNAF